MAVVVLIRGGGDLASGVALRLHRCGLRVIISELPQPLAVRRSVSFAEAVYEGNRRVEDCEAECVADPANTAIVLRILSEGRIPVLVDPNGDAAGRFTPDVIVDARMLKQEVQRDSHPAKLLIGLGPGFVAGSNCDVVIETNRGISMGRAIWDGPAEPNTRRPEAVAEYKSERILRAPGDGIVETQAKIGDCLEEGQLIANIGGQPVTAPLKGILRGLIHPGIRVAKGMKIGDLDPRMDPRACLQVSDKSLAVGGGVLEAILWKFRVFES